ncbi:MAG: hypothetical protein ACRCXD_00295 [Luteolibacter sp.]
MNFHHPLFSAASALVLAACTAHAAGVAVLKEQPFHRDSSATAVVYSRILDSRGPYLRLVGSRRNVEILRSHLIARIELPDALPAILREEHEIAPFRELLADVRNFTARYPQCESVLRPYSESLHHHIHRFDAGDVRFEGDWMSKKELESIQEAHTRELRAERRLEIEKFATEASLRGQGLEQGETRPQSTEPSTGLHEAIEPLWNGDLESAKFAVQNLTTLASGQSGVPKVRTERLLSTVRNLFLAEARVTHRIIASAAETQAAAAHDKNARDWLIPNSFGTTHPETGRDSHRKAEEIRQKSASEIAARKQELLEQLREMETVAQDFLKLREQRVAAILMATSRSVGGRHFASTEFPGSLF